MLFIYFKTICIRREGVSQEMGGRGLAKKRIGRWEVFRILDQDVGGFDFASQLRSRLRIEVRPTENDLTRLYKNGDISVVVTCS